MEPSLIGAGLLVALGLVLVLMEVFLPTGGLIGFLSVASLAAGIALAFYHGGSTTGFGFLAVAVVAVPVVLAMAFRFLPDTAIGRRLLPHLPTPDEVLPDSEERRRLRGLVGKVGRAKTPMLPSGAVLIEGHTIDAVSEGMAIERDQPVRVIAVRGTRVVVRPLDENEPVSPSDDVLSRPIDSLGFDPFSDPLA
jgi:membrane-bound ClpP family serine protease